MENLSDEKIIESWKKNVNLWLNAIHKDEIASRVLVTNEAIVEAVLSKKPNTVLDIGCGEGWLVRAIEENGINCLGIDVVPGFIQQASTGNGRFKELSYEALSFFELGEKFDLLVANFSLLGNESVEHIFQQAAELLNEHGYLIIQTIHPKMVNDDSNNTDGWRAGSWDGFNSTFVDPAPWYLRTLKSWKALFTKSGFQDVAIIEPLNPVTNKITSVIFVGKRAYNGAST